MGSSLKMKSLLIINNIPTPYRTYMFNVLHQVGKEYNVHAEVIFLAHRESHRHWNPNDFKMEFPYRFGRNLLGKEVEILNRGVLEVEVLRDLQRNKYDYLLVAPAQSLTNWLISLLPLQRTKKLLYSETNSLAVKRHNGLVRLFRKFLFRQFDGIVCPGELARDFIVSTSAEMNEKPFFYFPNVVNPDIFDVMKRRTAEEKRRMRKKLSLPQDSIIVAGIGTAPCKGGLQLLEACHQVYGNYHLALLGGSEHLAVMSKKSSEFGVQDRVLLPGQVDENTVRDYLLAADWFIHPAVYDCSPLACVEAAFSGLPLALSRQTGNSPELLQQNQNGITFDAFNIDAIIEALRIILATPRTTAEEMGRRSNQIACERFNAVTVSHRFYQWLLEAQD